MKVAVIGSGGVGGYFGGRIAHAGHDVTFIARGEHMKAMRRHGLRVKSINGDFVVKPVKVSDNLQDTAGAELIILGLKAWQVTGIARELRPFMAEGTALLPLQNGILAYDEISAELGRESTLGGLCRIFSKIESPGVIAHLGIDPAIIFGEMDQQPSERTERFLKVFVNSGIKSWIADDIQAELWKKFINICVSGLLAVARSTYGEIREMKETREMMTGLFEEIYALSQKAGIRIEHEFVGKTISFIDAFPYDSTSSLTRDVWEGKPSEIEYQNGTVVRLGEQYGVPTPVNRFIYNCILPMERRARGETGNR
jgi:2-dehydropantoate 2-reductase